MNVSPHTEQVEMTILFTLPFSRFQEQLDCFPDVSIVVKHQEYVNLVVPENVKPVRDHVARLNGVFVSMVLAYVRFDLNVMLRFCAWSFVL